MVDQQQTTVPGSIPVTFRFNEAINVLIWTSTAVEKFSKKIDLFVFILQYYQRYVCSRHGVATTVYRIMYISLRCLLSLSR